jgi:hypothetical protein
VLAWRVPSARAWMCAMRSVPHGAAPTAADRIRGEIVTWGVYCRPVRGGTEVTAVSMVDIGGCLPTTAVAQEGARAVLMILKLRGAVAAPPGAPAASS